MIVKYVELIQEKVILVRIVRNKFHITPVKIVENHLIDKNYLIKE
jgi:hypothetical protein